jgi:hypothetical protein
LRPPGQAAPHPLFDIERRRGLLEWRIDEETGTDLPAAEK